MQCHSISAVFFFFFCGKFLPLDDKKKGAGKKHPVQYFHLNGTYFSKNKIIFVINRLSLTTM
jgi:hypothetical protein